MKEKNYDTAIEESLRETRAVFVFECIAEFVLGVFLIIYPEYSSKVLSIVIGAVLSGVGVFNIISYLMSPQVPFRQGLFSGVIMTTVGISFIAQADKLIGVMAIILGVFTVFEGLSCCRRAFLMRQLEFKKWWIPFLCSMITCIAGVFMLIYPDVFGEIIQIIAGIALIAEAGLGLWTIFGIMVLRKRLGYIMNSSTSIIEVPREK